MPDDAAASEPQPDISIIIVSWNTRELLTRCLESIAAEVERGELGIELIVVDNGSTDGTVETIRRRFPAVQVIGLSENRGFAAANNVGIERARGRSLLLLNPDTELLPGALARLWAGLHAMPHVGLVGGRLLNPDGSLQSTGYRFPGLVQVFLDFFPLHPRLVASRLNGRLGPGDGLTPFAIDHPLGACMLVRREVLERVGRLDDGYFVYSEEIDWCRRIKADGWTILSVPAARVMHHGGQSTGQRRGEMFLELHRSRARYFARYHHRRFLRVVALLAIAAGRWARFRSGAANRSDDAGPTEEQYRDVASIYLQAVSGDR